MTLWYHSKSEHYNKVHTLKIAIDNKVYLDFYNTV